MVEDHKKSESEDESEIKLNVLIHHERIRELEKLVKFLAGEIEALHRWGAIGDKWEVKAQGEVGA